MAGKDVVIHFKEGKENLINQIDQMAREDDRSRSYYIVRAVEEYLSVVRATRNLEQNTAQNRADDDEIPF